MKKIVLIFLISVLSFSYQTKAQGDLLVTPTRVVFEGNKQKETLNLVNAGKDTASYSISFLQYHMKEDGSFELIDRFDSNQMFADPYLRVFPRRVTLAPGEPQAVMLQFRRKAEMLNGEYRSHLYFRSEKNTNPLGMNNSVQDTAELQVSLVPIFGLSIPVIIRTGQVNVSSTISDLSIETQNEILYLKLTINRTGNISLYGDITIEFIPLQGKPFEIGVVKGVGVYTSISKRDIIVKLDNEQALTAGILKVKYINSKEKKNPVYAEGELKIGY